VQGHERDVDAGLAQHQIDVAIDEQRPGVVSPVGQRGDDGFA
jgi:hypothetical protein